MTSETTVPVTLHVPESRVLEFQTRAVALIEELSGGAPTGQAAADDTWPLPPAQARARPLWGEGCPRWGSAEDDIDRAVWVLRHSTRRAVRLIEALVRTDGAEVTGDELGAASGYSKGARSVAPVLGAIGLRCRQVKRWAIWGWKAGATDEDSSTYEMPAQTTRLFEEALDRVNPDWRGSED